MWQKCLGAFRVHRYRDFGTEACWSLGCCVYLASASTGPGCQFMVLGKSGAAGRGVFASPSSSQKDPSA